MKQLIIFLFLTFSTCVSYAQSREDFENIMSRFQKFYNAGQSDSVREMFSDIWRNNEAMWKDLWTKEKNDGLIIEYGKLLSFKYIGEDEGGEIKVFKVEFEKSTHAMSMAVDVKKKLDTFRFKTTSPGIKRLMSSNG